jgi:hypothetical protein
MSHATAPSAYPLTFLNPAQAVNALRPPEPKTRYPGITFDTFTLWRQAGIILTLQLHPPKGQWPARRYPEGYIAGLAEHLHTSDPTWARSARKPDAAAFSRASAAAILLTKQAWDETIAAGTQADTGEPFISQQLAAEATGFTVETVRQRLSTSMGHLGPVVLRSTFDAAVTWHHEAFSLPLREQQRLMAGKPA